jgi:tripartite-type tricarboxylate transporter receptor subunit TctC
VTLRRRANTLVTTLAAATVAFAAVMVGDEAPAGTPPPIIAKLNAALNNALADDDIRSRLGADGTETLPGTPEAYAADIASEEAKWGAIIRQSGTKAE